MTSEADVYDRFNDYVRDKMRDRENPQVSLKEFDLSPPAGITHALFELENVRTGSEKLYSQVKEFAKGAYLKTREDPNSGNLVYVAYIPYGGSSSSSSKHHRKSRAAHSPPAPSVNWLFFYIFLLMALALFASFKTSAAEWRYIFRS